VDTDRFNSLLAAQDQGGDSKYFFFSLAYLRNRFMDDAEPEHSLFFSGTHVRQFPEVIIQGEIIFPD
jgi:hypothetical protein